MVYDFDFERPIDKKYSGGKLTRDSPNNDGTKPREITPLREMTAKLPPMRVAAPGDTTTTDHTTDNDSSFSTTEDETTTDDQMMPVVRYNFGPPIGYLNQNSLKQPDGSSRLYDPRNFQRIDSNIQVPSEKPVPGPQLSKGDQQSVSEKYDIPDLDKDKDTNESDKPNEAMTSSASAPKMSESAVEGPMPQVPSLPKDLQQTVRTSPPRELPWPHGPPPPYSAADNQFVV